MIVFLDIDGVCHPRVGGGGFVQSCMSSLRSALAPFEIDIVITSKWRDSCFLHEFVELLNILDKPVVGMTPILKQGMDNIRHKEILAYLAEHNLDDEWVAIDDTAILFPESAPVYITDSETGFTERDIEGLRAMIMSVGTNDN